MFCTKCGQEIPDGSVFCTYCGAKSGSSGTMAGSVKPDYSSKVEWQPTVTPVRKGLPVWGWVLIGCGGLFVLSIIAVVVAGLFMSKKMSEEFGGLENLQVVSELTVLQGAMHTYQGNKGVYGNFEELKSEGVLTNLTFETLEKFKIETKIGTYELLLPPDGKHFKINGTSKATGEKWELDENSGTLFDGMFGIDTSGKLTAPEGGS